MSFSLVSNLSVLAVGASLLLSGCAAAATSEPSASATSSSAIAVDEKAAALLPEEFKDGVDVASDIPYAPMEFFLEDNKTVTGFDYDLGQAIGAKLGVPFTFSDQDWDGIIPSLQAKKHDVIMSGMNDTTERQKVLDFVDYFKGGFSIIVQKGNPSNITKLTDLCGKKAAVQTATVQGDMLRALTPECKALSKPAVEILEFPTDPDANNALRAGKAVANLADAPIAAYTAQTAGDGAYFDLVVDAEKPSGYDAVFTGIGVLKGNDGLRDAIQAAVQSLIDDGNYAKILEKWNMTSFGITEATINGTK
jgi:polar amino acid transport system substrate-binding protein